MRGGALQQGGGPGGLRERPRDGKLGRRPRHRPLVGSRLCSPPARGATPPCFPAQVGAMPSRSGVPEQRCLRRGSAAPRVTLSSVSGFREQRVEELSPQKQGTTHTGMRCCCAPQHPQLHLHQEPASLPYGCCRDALRSSAAHPATLHPPLLPASSLIFSLQR